MFLWQFECSRFHFEVVMVFFSRSSEVQSLTTSSLRLLQGRCENDLKHDFRWTKHVCSGVDWFHRRTSGQCSAHSPTGHFPALSAVSVKPVHSRHSREACELLFHTLVMFLTVSVTSASRYSCWILPESWGTTRSESHRWEIKLCMLAVVNWNQVCESLTSFRNEATIVSFSSRLDRTSDWIRATAVGHEDH